MTLRHANSERLLKLPCRRTLSGRMVQFLPDAGIAVKKDVLFGVVEVPTWFNIAGFEAIRL